MSDISLPGRRAGLPVFDFVANEGPPSLLQRIGAYFVWAEPPKTAHEAAPPRARPDEASPEPELPAALVSRPAPASAPAPVQVSPAPAVPCAVADPALDAVIVRASWRSVQAERIRVVCRVLRVVGLALRSLCVFVAPRIWRIYRRWPATALAATGACGLMGFALVSAPEGGAFSGATGRTASAAESRGWIQIIKPAQVYSLESRDLGEAEPRYEASRYGLGMGRKDVLTFGAFGGADHPWLRLRLYRHGPEPRPEENVETSLAGLLHAEDLDIVSAEPLDDSPTRFGPMSTLRATLAGSRDDAGPLECLGFHIAAAGPALEIEGFACESPERLIQVAALECLVDRLDLLAGASDDELRLFFARVEPLRRRECGRPGAARSPERERPAQDHSARNGRSVSRT